MHPPQPEEPQPKEVWLDRQRIADAAGCNLLGTVSVVIPSKRQLVKVKIPSLLFTQAVMQAPDWRLMLASSTPQQMAKFAHDWFTGMAHRAVTNTINAAKESCHGHA